MQSALDIFMNVMLCTAITTYCTVKPTFDV